MPHRRGGRGARAITAAWALCLGGLAMATPPVPPKTDKPKEDDKKLGDRLIHKAASGRDEDVMAAVLRLMEEASQRLEIAFDPGEKTQALQRDIMGRLDEAIRIAAARRRPVRSKRSQATGDKRRRSGGSAQERGESSRSTGTREGGSGRRKESAGQSTDEQRAIGGRFRETRRTWGRLPMRERDEVIQGAGELFLERYRAWIERYYRSLQEPER
ncbi:MAG: hypothetical protein ACE5EX_00795 [Phycisphaerae bacterium]